MYHDVLASSNVILCVDNIFLRESSLYITLLIFIFEKMESYIGVLFSGLNAEIIFLHHVISNYCSYFIWKHHLINLEDLSHWSFESAATPEQSSNGYLLIATSGGLNQQRTGVSFYRNELLQEACMDMLLNCQYQYKKKKQLHIMF